MSQQRLVVMVTGYQLSKTIHKKIDITRSDGNGGQQGRGCQRVALSLGEGKAEGDPSSATGGTDGC